MLNIKLIQRDSKRFLFQFPNKNTFNTIKFPKSYMRSLNKKIYIQNKSF